MIESSVSTSESATHEEQAVRGPFAEGVECLRQLGIEVTVVQVSDFLKVLHHDHMLGDSWYAACPNGVYRSNLVNKHLFDHEFSEVRRQEFTAGSSRYGEAFFTLFEHIEDSLVQGGFVQPRGYSKGFNRLILCMTPGEGPLEKVGNRQLTILSSSLKRLDQQRLDQLSGFQIYLVLGNERAFEAVFFSKHP